MIYRSLAELKNKAVLQVGAHEELMMNYFRNFSNREISFDFVLRKDGIDFRFKNDPQFNGKLYYVTPIQNSTLRFIQDLRLIIKKEKYRVVHLHLGWANIYGIIAGFGLGVKVISHNHSYYKASTLTRNLIRFPVKFLINYFSWELLACSIKSKSEMFYGHRGHVLANAVDYDRFRFNEVSRDLFRTTLGFGDKIVFTHVGNFLEQKNQLLLISIFNLIRSRCDDSILVLVGDDYGAMSAVKQKAKALGIGNDVLFLGARDDIPEILSASDIFLFPSMFEGFGIALLEAQVNGLPCVYSNTIPSDAIITSSCFSCGIEECNHEDWMSAVYRCIDLGLDKKSRIERSNTISSVYDMKNVAHELEAIYLRAFYE